MAKTVPEWYGRPWGPNDQNSWDDAIERSLDVLRGWAARRHYNTYGAFVDELQLLAWPEGPFTGHGTQVGDLLGHVGVHEWLENRPLLSALAVQAEEGGGKGLPGGGWFDFCRRLGLMADEHDEDERLRVWSDQVDACFSRRRIAYPTETPDW